MKLHHILEAQHHAGSNKIDLAKLPTNVSKEQIRKAISEFWTEGVFYKGENLFKMYYEENMDDFFKKELHEELKQYHDLYSWDAQESYLGYIPNEDAFIAGFDTWAEVKNDWYDWQAADEDDYDEEEYHQDSLENFVKFTLEGGGPKDWEVLNKSHGMVYPHGYKDIHSDYPKLIDVRLD